MATYCIDKSSSHKSHFFFRSSLHELAAWLTFFVSNRATFTTYYETWAFILVHGDNDLFERITNQLEKLSPLPFRLKYTHSSQANLPARVTTVSTSTTATTNTANQRPSSLLPRRFNVRAWLRDRKTQVKISPKEPQAPSLPLPQPPPPTSSMKKSPSNSAIPLAKSVPSAPTKTPSVTPTATPIASSTNVSSRRKLGSIPVPKRNQTVH